MRTRADSFPGSARFCFCLTRQQHLASLPRMAKSSARREYVIISVRQVDKHLWRELSVFALRRGMALGEALNLLLSRSLPKETHEVPSLRAPRLPEIIQ